MTVITTDALMTDGGRATSAAPSSSAPKKRRSWAWLGVVPFLSFLVLFLIVPAITVFSNSLKTADGDWSLSAMKESFSGQNLEAFKFTFTFALGAAFVGLVFGTLIAYAAATALRPRWLRSVVTAFSGVAANMGGIALAFMFLSLLGRQGVGTKIMEWAGYDLYGGEFKLGNVTGLIIVYSYFNVPLMVLAILPAIDGLKQSWREACANLGGTSTTYWRRIGLPVLAPSLLGGFLLLFVNSFAAFATASALTDNSKIIALRIGFFLGGDVNVGEDAVGYGIAAWMIIVMGGAMGLYWLVRKRAERWRS